MNPILGVVLHWLGGLAAGSFYVPYRGVKKWSWETYWLVGGFFSWIIAPWVVASIGGHALLSVLSETPSDTLVWTFFWGAMWGVGGLTFGLTMRYLGMSLGMGVALGFCAAFGTLVPPIFHGEFVDKILRTTSGGVNLIGIGACLLGITLAAMAGISKERELSGERKKATIAEFNLTRGLCLATFSGAMSASFSFGLDAAKPMTQIALDHGTPVMWTGLPKLVVVLLGGFTTNLIWCVFLNLKNKTGHEYFAQFAHVTATKTGEETMSGNPVGDPTADRVPLRGNYAFCALAGVTWYFQFFFYTMGETQMGKYGFSSWTLHMAGVIIFSSIWGLSLKEWRGSGPFTKALLWLGLAVLMMSTVIIGYGNYLAK